MAWPFADFSRSCRTPHVAVSIRRPVKIHWQYDIQHSSTRRRRFSHLSTNSPIGVSIRLKSSIAICRLTSAANPLSSGKRAECRCARSSDALGAKHHRQRGASCCARSACGRDRVRAGPGADRFYSPHVCFQSKRLESLTVQVVEITLGRQFG